MLYLVSRFFPQNFEHFGVLDGFEVVFVCDGELGLVPAEESRALAQHFLHVKLGHGGRRKLLVGESVEHLPQQIAHGVRNAEVLGERLDAFLVEFAPDFGLELLRFDRQRVVARTNSRSIHFHLKHI